MKSKARGVYSQSAEGLSTLVYEVAKTGGEMSFSGGEMQ
jgi:hypothetical protein